MRPEELASFPDRFTLQFVREYPHPVERVWRALTDPAEVGVWFMPLTVDLRLGGRYAFRGEAWGEIAELDPPRRIRFGKDALVLADPSDAAAVRPGENWFQFELEESAGGTRLTFTEHWQPGLDYRGRSIRKFGASGDDLPGGPDSPFHPVSVAGWHGALDAIALLLAGEARHEDRTAFYRSYLRDQLREAAPSPSAAPAARSGGPAPTATPPR